MARLALRVVTCQLSERTTCHALCVRSIYSVLCMEYCHVDWGKHVHIVLLSCKNQEVHVHYADDSSASALYFMQPPRGKDYLI